MDRAKLQALHDLSGRVALVTGGTRGLGRALAEGFVASGAQVALCGRKAEACAETAEHLRAMGGEVLAVPMHLGDLDAVRGLVDQTVERFGRLDILVNNAATALAQPVGQFTPEAWTKVFDVDLRGPVFLTQEAIPHLEKSGHGVVINVISGAAFMFANGQAMYAAAKGGLVSMTRAMAADFAPRGIRINAVSPGAMDTDMVRNNTPEAQAEMAEGCLMKRLGQPDEFVGPVLFLASDASSFVTGQVLMADGGRIPY